MESGWDAIDNANHNQINSVLDIVHNDATHDRSGDDEVRKGQDAPAPSPKTARRRGRSVKDPLNQTFLFECRDSEDMETCLREFLRDTTSAPEHTSVEFRFPASAAFMVYPPGHSQAVKDPLKRILNRKAVSVVEALQPTYNPKDQMEKQRSIAKVCVEAVTNADGFRYGFNNNWISKEDGASRFSYFCNDSSANKARAGNPTASHRVAHKKAQKPVYECEGTITIKFWASKQMLEVIYRHIPCHETYAARAPTPRKGTRRRLLMEVFEPEKLPTPRKPSGLLSPIKEGERKGPEQNRGLPSGKTGGLAQQEASGNVDQSTLQVANVVNGGATAPAPLGIPTLSRTRFGDFQNVSTLSFQASNKRKTIADGIQGQNLGFTHGEGLRVGTTRPTKKQKVENTSRPQEAIFGQSEVQSTSDKTIPASSDEPNANAIQQLMPSDIAILNFTEQRGMLEEPSEIEMLKAKLAQAENRIQQLEAEVHLLRLRPP